MIIFDWDDTILSTTYLGSIGFVDISTEVRKQLDALDLSGVSINY